MIDDYYDIRVVTCLLTDHVPNFVEDFKTVSDFKAVDWTSIKSHVVDWPRDVPFA